MAHRRRDVVTEVVHPDFQAVADLVPTALRRARGGAVAVYHRGELVVDAWTGLRDTSTGEPWERDTTAMAWSTTKGVTSAALHLVVQRGALDYDDLVADHWPEFAAGGKATTTVRHVLTHEAGLHDIRSLIPDARAMLDHDTIAAALAQAEPAYEPGTANGYHALTYGSLVDELVRRTTGGTLAELVRREIAEPLGLDGFAIGTSTTSADAPAPPPPMGSLGSGARRIGRAANVVTRIAPARLDLRAIAAAFIPHGGDVIGTPEFLKSGNGSIGGVFTARDLARFYAAFIATDGLGGVAPWSTDTVDRAATEQNDRRDAVLSIRPRWTLGFHRPWPRRHLGPGAFGFFGMFGSGAWADRDRQLTVALVCPDGRGLPLVGVGKAAIAAADRR